MLPLVVEAARSTPVVWPFASWTKMSPTFVIAVSVATFPIMTGKAEVPIPVAAISVTGPPPAPTPLITSFKLENMICPLPGCPLTSMPAMIVSTFKSPEIITLPAEP